MKKIFSLLVLVSLFATSCSELDGYDLPYELSPVSDVSLQTVVTAANAVCPGPVATFTVDSESTVYYVLQLEADDALTSDDVFSDGDDISFEAAGSEEVEITGLVVGESYTLYAVTVNKNGIRSDEVTSTDFVTPGLSEVVNPMIVPTYVGSPSAFGAQSPQYLVDFTAEGNNTFVVPSLWGPNFVAWAYDDPSYEGLFLYPGTITIHDDFTVTIASEWAFAEGGEGTYDPCTGTFDLTLLTSAFGDADPDTEEVEHYDIDVTFSPYEDDGEGEGDES